LDDFSLIHTPNIPCIYPVHLLDRQQPIDALNQIPRKIMVNELTIGIPATQRTALRRLGDLLPQIEHGLANGYSHAAMHAELTTLGIYISLPYYHKVIHRLRKEQRQGARPPSLAPLSVPQETAEALVQVQQAGEPKASNLSTGFTERSDSSAGTISVESGTPAKFRWKGEEILNRDWSKF
jgi:hypothetical protein